MPEPFLARSGNVMKYDKYLPEQYISPFWSGDTVINESVLPLENEDGELFTHRAFIQGG